MPHSMIVVLLTIALGAAATLGCSCRDEPTPCEAYGRAGAVFTGKVLREKRIGEFTGRRTEYEIQVLEVFAREFGRTVIAESYTDACGYGFRVGKEYLIYGGEAGYVNSPVDRFAATYCSRTRPLGDAAVDLKFLREEIKTMKGSRIYGWVKEDLTLRHDLPAEKRRPPIGGFGLKVIGPDRTHELTTDSKGDFALTGLPAGKYFIELIPTTAFYTEGREREEFHVNANGCAENNFYLSRN